MQFRGSEFVLVFQFVQCDNIYLTVSGKLTGMVYQYLAQSKLLIDAVSFLFFS